MKEPSCPALQVREPFRWAVKQRVDSRCVSGRGTVFIVHFTAVDLFTAESKAP